MKEIEGYVIKTEDFADKDKILTIFTKEHGVLGVVALGVKKQESKNKFGTQLFAKSSFEIFKSNLNRLSKLKKAHLIKNNFKISESYFNYVLATIVSNVTIAFFQPNEKSFEYYRLLDWIITKLDNNQFPLKNFAIYLFRALKFNNSTWDLYHCVKCEKKLNNAIYFKIDEYGVLCEEDYISLRNKDGIITDPEFIETLKEINSKPVGELDNISLNIEQAILIINILLEYYESILGVWSPAFKELKSQSFM